PELDDFIDLQALARNGNPITSDTGSTHTDISSANRTFYMQNRSKLFREYGRLKLASTRTISLSSFYL
ncbi:MAG: hypothetical protein P4L83_19395, partial [Nevskia sp.]|nr:hypothetical protein [Nevskia sp.]